MSDPQNLNNTSPGGFRAPTQPVENALVPAQTNPSQAAVQSSSTAQPNAQQSVVAQFAGATRLAAATLGDGLNVPIVVPQVPNLQPGGSSSSGGGSATFYATAAAFPAAATVPGQFAVANDSTLLYISAFGAWWPIVALS